MKDAFTIDSRARLYGRHMASDRAVIAHVLRRTTFGPHPGQVEEFVHLGASDTIDALLRGPIELLPGGVIDSTTFDGSDKLALWWLERMRQPGTGVHEKLVWYWHGHFTSSLDKVPERLLWRQHNLLRRHALGNFRALVQAITIDPAMLRYLDGDGSRGDAPNENYARELMELFCLGSGNYTEDDVRAAAHVFAGWRVDDQKGTAAFDPEAGYDRPVTFFGRRQRWSARDIVDAIVDHPACARHVARRLWAFYVATPLSDARLEELAQTFRSTNLDIKALIEAILRSSEFLDARHARARQPLEWLLATLAVTGATTRKMDLDWFEQLGQAPFRPPNVAGWSLDNRWVSAGQVLLRTSVMAGITLDKTVIDRVAPDTAAVLAQCGIYDASPTTYAAMESARKAQTEFDRGLELLLALAVTTPEFSLA